MGQNHQKFKLNCPIELSESRSMGQNHLKFKIKCPIGLSESRPMGQNHQKSKLNCLIEQPNGTFKWKTIWLN